MGGKRGIFIFQPISSCEMSKGLNDFVRYELSDISSSVSLQNVGLVPIRIGCSFWPGKSKVF